ncbi:MAG TPA: ATP-binding protein [Ferruginibacter sp.]|jgi:signal transduction histidine kinase|nr:ATP-binding protein [Ferruginibacter sp.]
MTRCFFLLLLFYPGTTNAQQYKNLDAIADPVAASQKIHAELAKDPGNPEWYCLLAVKKRMLSEYDSCIFYSNKCIDLLTKKPNNKLLIIALDNKGASQYNLDDKHKADTNWRQALQIAIRENDYAATTTLATSLGAIYLDERYLTDKNIHTFSIADSFFAIAYKEYKAKDSLASYQGLRTLRLMATSLQFQKKYDSANYYYRQVLSLSKNINPNVYLLALSFYAQSLSEMGKHEQAIVTIKEAAELVADSAAILKDKEHIMHVYGEVLYASANYKEAYLAIDSSFNLLANEYQRINTKSYSESESKFRNQLLQYQVQLEQQKKTRLYYLIAGLVLLTALTLLWLYSRANRRITMEKARQKQIAIDAFIEGEEKEKARIGRELHDGIAQEIVAVKLAMQQENATSGLVNELTRISLDIRNISHELMPQTLKEFGLKLAIEDICQKILAPSGIQYEIHSMLPGERMENKIEITLYRIFQELVHNIIKHSQATEVLVQLRKMNNHVVLVVEDNGKGMTEDKKNGIGISNLKSRVQLLDGNLQYDSSENEGTTAIVRVPV